MSFAGIKHQAKRRVLDATAVRRTLAAFAHDARRYLAHSSSRGPYATRANLAAKITERYHSIEKGLALPEPRPAFGRGVLPVLIRLVETYIERYGEDDVTRAAVGALAAYVAFNDEHGVARDDLPAHTELLRLVESRQAHPRGVSGTRAMTRDDVLAATSATGLDFFTTRHSTRVFSAEPVTPEQIAFAVDAARSAPAVCNREFSHVTVWTDPARVEAILDVQGGARGFGHQVPALAMVTVDLRTYWSEAERNQGWIDGGLFSMSFMLGLHAQGLGSVPLNWSKSVETDRRMRALVGLDDARSIIMFIGFGHLPEEYRVAASPRREQSAFYADGALTDPRVDAAG